jgi:dTDP-glucose pyrophosphorylase
MNNITTDKSTIQNTLSKLEDLRGSKVLFIENKEGVLIGTITDGDIRRFLIKGGSVQNSIVEAMNTSFKYLTEKSFTLEEVIAIRNENIFIVPLLDSEGRIVRFIDLSKRKSFLPIDAVIMAGGKGTRLMPLTKYIPKPLLKVGDKAIIQYNVDHLINYGVLNIHISINHFGDQIVNYFEKENLDANITFIEENEPLGTIGALSLVSNFHSEYILLMNSDLLTNVDLELMFKRFIELDLDMIIGTIPYTVNIPYAVIESSNNLVIELSEKPDYTYECNSGIYIIHKKHLALIPKGELFNAPDLAEKLIQKKGKVGTFLFHDYWLDIGKHKDFMRAQEDIKRIQF